MDPPGARASGQCNIELSMAKYGAPQWHEIAETSGDLLLWLECVQGYM